MKTSIRLAVLISFFLVGCSANEPKTLILEGNFPLSISPDLRELSEIEIVCPDELIFINGYLLIINNCHEKILQVVSLSSMQNKFFINKGKGPAEMQNAYFSGHQSGDSLLLINSPSYYAWVHPARMFNDEDYFFNKRQDTYVPFQNINVFQIQDNWIYNDLDGEGFFVFRDKSGAMMNSVDFLPISSYAAENNQGYVYYSWTRYNEYHKVFVSALRYFPFLLFTDNEGLYKKIIQTQQNYREPVFPNQKKMPDEGAQIFNLGVQTSESYIYLYNPNLKVGDQETKADPTIEVFSWEGEPVLELRLNALVGAVVFDFENGKGYGLKFFPDQFRLGIAEIKIPADYRHFFMQ